jgi:hypothetical protein
MAGAPLACRRGDHSLGRIWWDPRIVNGELGATPIFN